jgi:hypothetical protein
MSETTNIAIMRILVLKLTCLFYTVTLRRCSSKGNENTNYCSAEHWWKGTAFFLISVCNYLSVCCLRDLAEKFCKTCNIQIRHDRQLYCFLGSALYIRPEKNLLQNKNCVNLLNFGDLCPRSVKIGTKLQPSVGRAESRDKDFKICFIILCFNKILLHNGMCVLRGMM